MKENQDFTAVPTRLLLDQEMSIEARGLAAVLYAENKADLDMKHLRQACGVGRDKLAAMLAVLAAHGVVNLTRNRADDGRMDGQVWRFVGGQK